MQAARVALQSATKLATQGGAVASIPAPQVYEPLSKPFPSARRDIMVATALGLVTAVAYKVRHCGRTRARDCWVGRRVRCRLAALCVQMWYWNWKKEVNQYYYDLERSQRE